ncbi:MAG: Gfo/Idh/MocA family oxidoreductase [Candidatus Methanomethyliaceae archaeon]|nr:Gfo/Idh/MocA family oxidoreductase [Candidatus Methanomethyliaceae archaeon]
MHMLKVGVVGVGVMGRNHARIYSSTDGCELIGVLDINPEMAKEVAKEHKVPAFTRIEDLLAAKPDAVSIVVPTSSHKDVSLKFLEKGIACLVEKPISSTVEDAEVMIRSAERNGAILMVGHIERFNPAVFAMKSIISNGELGEIFTLSAKRAGPFDPRIKDVGIIVDLMTHDIDVCRYLVGREPLAVHAVYGKYKRDVEDFASLILDFEGAIATIEANRFTPYKVRTLNVTGSIGIAMLDYLDQTVEMQTGLIKRRVEVQKMEPLRVEIEHFLECVRKGKEPLVDGEEGLKNLKIALEALKCGSSR